MPDEVETKTASNHAGLTVVPGKLAYYQEEEGDYLATGLAAATRAHGAAMPEVLAQVAVMVVQPDGIARRQVDEILSFLDSHDFEPLFAVPFQLTVPMSRVLWRFQFTAIGPDSKAIGEGVYCHGQSLMLVLKDRRASTTRPGSSRLAGIKGSSDPAKRGPESLRSRLGALNRIFGCVHCADEPLDILRELAILFTEPVLSELHERLARTVRDGADDCRPEIDNVYAACGGHDLNSERALNRLLSDIEAAGAARDAVEHARQLVDMVVTATKPGATLDWFAFVDGLTALGIDPAGWDPLLVAADNIEYELPGAVKLIGSFSSA
ncbi:hypothetical protein F4560_002712 [Saccharothrix ecbatanensis]|uniref:Nucleoside diphosphate kinase n=1 Tax=Saccharothrix ecbatanensis TaxID=1105145 RepID=A0A7W9HJF7_9PSEU|nr:hypothetical protein [Saccharothrix ecbatanensis]MBB5802944.1 hypothetical protein [Saccharothrix ecbatanensis]